MSNVASLNAERWLSRSSASLDKTFSRLSSGLRINRASDDAAGLSIASALAVDQRVHAQGIRNFNDGIAALDIAESTLGELSNIVIRIEELAVQSANGVLGSKQRQALDDEAQALSEEFLRISRNATYNGIGLLDGSVDVLSLQAGYGAQGTLAATLGGALGTGNLAAGTSLSTESFSSYASAVGDLNNDGYLDLVTAGRSDASDGFASVFLGQGDGTFVLARSYTTEGFRTVGITLGDVNGDGILDMLSAGYDDGNDGYDNVRLGRGDGTFGTATSYVAESRASDAIELGDLNGDGILDMVTSGTTDAFDGLATVRLGLGGGTFGAAVTYANESRVSQDLALGDVNGDGILDLVTAGATDALDGFTTIRLGRGDGTFGTALSYATESQSSHSVALGDLNGDNILDIVTAGLTDSGDGTATVRLGVGNGTFGAATSFVTESGASYGVVLTDLQGDGGLDIVSAGTTDLGDGYLTVFLGNLNGTFRAAVSYATESAQSRAISTGDFNGDGVADIVTAGNTDGSDGAATVRLSTTRDGVAAILPFDIGTLAGARQALPIIRRKREQLATQRGQIGALHSRASVAINTLQISLQNYAAAESAIRDADIASESAELVRNRILQQAGVAVLAQANQSPQLALLLLNQNR